MAITPDKIDSMEIRQFVGGVCGEVVVGRFKLTPIGKDTYKVELASSRSGVEIIVTNCCPIVVGAGKHYSVSIVTGSTTVSITISESDGSPRCCRPGERLLHVERA